MRDRSVFLSLRGSHVSSRSSASIAAKQDHAIAPDLELLMAQRAHAHTIEVNGSHSVMVSHPDTVAQLIENAAWITR
jgi:hypothetical protein